MPLKILNAIICDHVRIEDNGKHILIGVYVGSVVFPGFPSMLAPTLWLQLITDAPNQDLELEFKLDGPTGLTSSKIGTAKINVRSGEDRGALVILNAGIVQYHAPGKLVFHVRPKGGRWMAALTKDVIQMPSASPPT
jgi:hypothetical protein